MRIVDRRLNPGGKSFSNRQRFLRRVKDTVTRAVRDASGERMIGDLENAQEVTVPAEGAREPLFRHVAGERRDFFLPGNRDYVEGDLIDRPTGEGGGGAEAGRGGGQEDAFRFVLTREEFLSIFLDDLELPDFAKKGVVDTQKLGIRRAGYTTSGTPSNLSLGRTMQRSLARRIAMNRPRGESIEQLEAEIARGTENAEAAAALDAALRAARERRLRIPFLDPVDLRYRRFERFPKPVAQAVMFCLMDVSGSMSEHMKDLAKRFFMLLHVFLTRRYQRVEIVFIRHTDEAREVDEDTFFRSAESGGTVVSSALVEMDRIIADRFDPASWNIYGAQASDGDNLMSDNERARELLQDRILPVSQYFAYLEVANSIDGHPFPAYTGKSSLWDAYTPLTATERNFQMRRVSRRDQIYPVFRELFQRRDSSVSGAPK
jgi:uncharacterized sporulation protein YeaH/YhbH (DUF444 family)